MNTSGGGLSYTHSGMYGSFLLVEAVRQLRERAATDRFTRRETPAATRKLPWLTAPAALYLPPERFAGHRLGFSRTNRRFEPAISWGVLIESGRPFSCLPVRPVGPSPISPDSPKLRKFFTLVKILTLLIFLRPEMLGGGPADHSTNVRPLGERIRSDGQGNYVFSKTPHCRKGLLKKHTEAYRNDLSQFLLFLQQQQHCSANDTNPWDRVDLDVLNAYIEDLRGRKGYRDTTTARKVAAVKSFFGFLHENGTVAIDPTESLGRPGLAAACPNA